MTEVLRECLREAKSLRAVAEETDVNVATLSLFLRGMSSLRLDKADKLIAYFGIECRRRPARKG